MVRYPVTKTLLTLINNVLINECSTRNANIFIMYEVFTGTVNLSHVILALLYRSKSLLRGISVHPRLSILAIARQVRPKMIIVYF